MLLFLWRAVSAILNILKFVSLKHLKRKAQDILLHCSFIPDMQKASFIVTIGTNFSIMILYINRRKGR